VRGRVEKPRQRRSLYRGVGERAGGGGGGGGRGGRFHAGTVDFTAREPPGTPWNSAERSGKYEFRPLVDHYVFSVSELSWTPPLLFLPSS
jgi:hypothetical protein